MSKAAQRRRERTRKLFSALKWTLNFKEKQGIAMAARLNRTQKCEHCGGRLRRVKDFWTQTLLECRVCGRRYVPQPKPPVPVETEIVKEAE